MEMDWMPSVEQVKVTLPSPFKEKFATYANIDGMEVFIETPSDISLCSNLHEAKINNIILLNSLLHGHQMEEYATFLRYT